MAKPCMKRKDLLAMVRAVAQETEIKNAHPDVRVNIWNIKTDSYIDMMTKLKIPSGMVDQSKRVYEKLTNAAERVRAKKSVTVPFIQKLMQSYDVDGELIQDPDAFQKEDALRTQSIALKEVMDQIKGERDKADSNNIPLNDVSPDGGVLPFLPAPRVAAEIGRKIAYLNGIVFTKNRDLNMQSKHVELAYYNLGMSALENLQRNGFIDIYPEGKSTIQDYLDNPDAKPKYNPAEMVTQDVPAIALLPKSVGISNVKKGNDVKFFTEDFVAKGSNIEAFDSVLQMSNLLSVPSRITFPSVDNPNDIKRIHKDDYDPDATTKKVKKEIESAPTYIDEDLDGFLTVLHKELKDGDTSASQWVREEVLSDAYLMDLFGVEKSNPFISDKASYVGRNLSKTTPIDDLVEYYNQFQGQAALYMGMFAGRNARLYNDHSVINPQTSKLMRHMLSFEKGTLEVGSQDYYFHVDKVARELDLNDDYQGVIEGLFDNSDSSQIAKDISTAIRHFETFQKAKTANAKLSAIKAMSDKFPGLDFAQLTTTIKAAKEIRDSRDQKTMETTYMVGSDATASGATITLEQAIGANPEAITELLQGLGVFKNPDGKVPTVRDVYAILETKLQEFTSDWETESSDKLDPPADPEAMREIVRKTQDVLFKGKTRDLSKDPTMVFIYRQAEAGAINTMSINFSDRMIEQLKKKPVSQDALDLLTLVMNSEQKFTANDVKAFMKDPDFKHKLRGKFRETELPQFLYNALRQAVSNKYTKPYDKMLNEVFDLIESQDPGADFRIYPAGYKMDDAAARADGIDNKATYTKDDLKKHGIPLTKVFEAINEVGGESVLTRIQRLRNTVLGVSTVHGIDTQKEYHSLDGLIPENGNRGVIAVHDALYGFAPLVRQWEQNYVDNDRKTARDYDILEEALEALRVFKEDQGVDLNGIQEYTDLRDRVLAAKKTKQELIDKHYDSETTSIIGDNIDYDFIADANQRFTTPRSEQPAPKPKRRATAPQETEQTQETETQKASQSKPVSVKSRVEQLAATSPIIQAFLKSPNAADVVETDGKFSSYQISKGQDQIVLSGTKSDAETTRELEHEIIHSYTDALFRVPGNKITDNQTRTALRYIEKAARDIRFDLENGNLPTSLAGIGKAVLHPDPIVAASELVAVLNSEPNLAKSVYSHYGAKGSRLEQMIQNLVDAVRKMLTGEMPTVEDLSLELDSEKLHNSMQHVIATGQSLRSNQAEWANILNGLPDSTVYSPESTGKTKKVHVFEQPEIDPDNPLNLINQALSRRLNDPLVSRSADLLKWADALLKIKAPAYRRVLQRSKRVYEDSAELQGWMHKISNGNIDNLGKNWFLSWANTARTNNKEIVDLELRRFKEITNKMTDAEKKDFYDFTTRMSFADYLMVGGNRKNSFDKAAEQARKKINNKATIAKLDALIDMNINDNVTRNTPYNIAEVLKTATNENAIRQYVVFKSIDMMGAKRFRKMLKNGPLIDAVADITLSNKHLMTTESNISTLGVRDSGLVDSYNAPILKKVITLDELSKYDYDKGDGWKIAQRPTKDSLGVIYRESIDSTYQDGVFLDLQQNTGDVTVPARFKNMPNVIKVGKEYKYIVPHDTKVKMGLVTNAEQALVRSMGHNLLIKDTNNLRDAALQRERFWDMNQENMRNLESVIKDPTRDHPWLLGGDMDYDDLPTKVRAKYMPVAALNKRMSNVKSAEGQLGKKVKWVRKDIAYWLIGTSEQSIARDPKVQKVLRVTKNVVSMAKMGMVITNPMKITMDNVSNIAQLGVSGVDPLYIERQYRTISQEFNDYKKLRNEMLMLRVKSYADPDKYSKKIKQLETRLADHPANGFVERGFINSLGSDLVSQADDPSAGLKSDIDKVLKALFQTKEGRNNAVGQFLMNFGKFGDVGIEDFLETLAKPFKGIPLTEIMGEEMDRVADRLRDIKNEDDLVSYLHQYLNSPDSEFVKLGAHMTDLSDVMAKETYYRYLTDGGMDPKKAEVEVIDMFPDYKEGMPKSMQQLSDLGILMFPNYWVRVQKAIYRLAKGRPVSFGTELAIEQWLGINAPQIWDQNIYNKATSNWGLFHLPWDHLGIGTLFPINII